MTRVLLDECLPRRLAAEITGHDVQTVPEVGWAGKTNGELLDLARGKFDVFVTIDQGIEYEQSLRDAQIAIVMLRAASNRIEHLRPLLPQLLAGLDSLSPGQLHKIQS